MSTTHPSLTTLDALDRMLAEATVGSKRLDAEVFAALVAPAGSRVTKSEFSENWFIYRPHPTTTWGIWFIPDEFEKDYRVTQSLTAAVALVELHPGLEWTVARSAGAWVSDADGDPTEAQEAQYATPALSLCGAYVRYRMLAMDKPSDPASPV